jgi:hypothetical protein
MIKPLGQSNTPSLLNIHPTNQPQTFCTILPSPKGIARCAYNINPSATAFLTATDISDTEKIQTSISEAVRHQFTSCGGNTNLLSRSHDR